MQSVIIMQSKGPGVQQAVTRQTEMIRVPEDKVGRLIGKKGTTIKAIEGYACLYSARVIENEEGPYLRLVGTPEAIERAKLAIQSVLYCGVMYADEAKFDESAWNKIEAKTGVEIKLCKTAERFELLVLIIGSEDQVQAARKLVNEKIHYVHTPTNMARKQEKVRKREDTKKKIQKTLAIVKTTQPDWRSIQSAIE